MTTIAQNVAEKVAYLKSVAAQEGYDIPAILRKEAAYLRQFKAAHKIERAEFLEAAAAEYESEAADVSGIAIPNEFAARFDISMEEAKRIAAVATSEANFIAIWENEAWWTDGENA